MHKAKSRAKAKAKAKAKATAAAAAAPPPLTVSGSPVNGKGNGASPGKGGGKPAKDPGRNSIGNHEERRAAEAAAAVAPTAMELAAAYAAHAAEFALANPKAAMDIEDLAQSLLDAGPPLQADVDWLKYFVDQPRAKRASVWHV